MSPTSDHAGWAQQNTPDIEVTRRDIELAHIMLHLVEHPDRSVQHPIIYAAQRIGLPVYEISMGQLLSTDQFRYSLSMTGQQYAYLWLHQHSVRSSRVLTVRRKKEG